MDLSRYTPQQIDTYMNRRCAAIVILRDGNKILFLRRANVAFAAGKWGLPGGKVDANESYATAAARELKEEVGVVAKNLKHVHTLHRIGTFHHEWTDVVFECTEWDGEPRNAEPHKADAMMWAETIPENAIDFAVQILNCVSKGITYSEWGWD